MCHQCHWFWLPHLLAFQLRSSNNWYTQSNCLKCHLFVQIIIPFIFVIFYKNILLKFYKFLLLYSIKKYLNFLYVFSLICFCVILNFICIYFRTQIFLYIYLRIQIFFYVLIFYKNIHVLIYFYALIFYKIIQVLIYFYTIH